MPLIHLSSDFIRAKEYLEAIFSSASDAICTTDTNGRILYFSPGAERMLGFPCAEVIGTPSFQFYPDGIEEARRVMAVLRKQGTLTNQETVLKTKDGRHIHVSMSASLIRDRAGTVIGTLAISKDITSRVELENRLRELSITDTLTGLFNRRHFYEKLKEEARRARRQREKLSMILIDLDGFKEVNDLRGHLEGDRILHAFAATLRESIRKEVDSAYRLGGDEFTVLLPGLGSKRAHQVAKRVVSAGSAKTSRGGTIGFSYGVATLSPTQSIPDFVHQADSRMFQMKASRKKRSASLAI